MTYVWQIRGNNFKKLFYLKQRDYLLGRKQNVIFQWRIGRKGWFKLDGPRRQGLRKKIRNRSTVNPFFRKFLSFWTKF